MGASPAVIVSARVVSPNHAPIVATQSAMTVPPLVGAVMKHVVAIVSRKPAKNVMQIFARNVKQPVTTVEKFSATTVERIPVMIVEPRCVKPVKVSTTVY